MKKSWFQSIVLLGLVWAFVLVACRKEEFSTNSADNLRFSTDTVLFDTVFTEVGSTTKVLTLYNDSRKSIRTNVELVGGNSSSYQVNVDGISGTSFSDIVVGPQDSIFVFVTVTVTPNQDASYPFVDDQLVFVTNGTAQSVDLVAWGWDAQFFFPTTSIPGLPPFSLVAPAGQADVTWTAEKPIVIYGYVVVDSLQRLTIEAGTQIFFHANSGLWVYNGGQLTVNGSFEEPVTFQGDRLEAEFDDVSGQWDRIWINEGSQNNVIRYADIRNAFIGIQAETLPFAYNLNAPNTSNQLIIENTRIANSSFANVFLRNYKTTMANCQLGAAGSYSLVFTGGGSLRMDHTTIANNFSAAIRNTPTVLITNVFERGDELVYRQIEDISITNSILYGNLPEEVVVAVDETFAAQPVQIQHSLLGETELVPGAEDGILDESCVISSNPGFVDFTNSDFKLNPESPAIALGNAATSLFNVDLDQVPFANPPAAGCFEFVP